MLCSHRLVLVTALGLGGLVNASVAHAARPVVAVFGLESKGARLKAKDLDRLSDYIGASLTESGRYLVVPRDELKAAIARQKANSYKECYAQSCQIDIGKELAAEKSLAGSVSKFGHSCLVTLTLFDLAKATQEAAGTAKGACGEDAVLESVDKALAKLAGAPVATPVTRNTAPPPPPPPPPTVTIQGADYGDLEAEIQAAAAKAAQAEAERKARELAARRDWKKISRYVKGDTLKPQRRAQILEKFLATFTQDNPHEAEARGLLDALRGAADMVSVPAGYFQYGCNRSVDTECESDEATARRVYVKAFQIDKTEVTAGAFKKCVLAGGCTKPKTGGKCNYDNSSRANHPINCVNWAQAKRFCEWKKKRLPSEMEWERAARGSDGRKYPWGNTPVSCSYAVVKDKKNGCGRDGTWPVMSKPRGVSPYGAHDMLGNVWEWTSDLYKGGPKRSTRGGSFSDLKKYARNSNRLGAKADSQYYSYGFRCAR